MLFIHINWIYKIWFGLVWFDGISTIDSYLMPNPAYTYILNRWNFFVGIYGISSIVGYLMPNHVYKINKVGDCCCVRH